MCESAESFFNPEIQMAADLVRRLHEHKQNALQLQHDLEDMHARALQPIGMRNYLTYFPQELPQIPARHHRLVFGPHHEQEPYGDIERIVVRYPDTSDDFYPEAESGREWGDIFIEVIDPDGLSQNYLLNNKGFQPFDTADTDIIEDMDFDSTGDLFAVYHTSAKVKVPVDLFTLSYLLTDPNRDDSYMYLIQTKDVDPPLL